MHNNNNNNNNISCKSNIYKMFSRLNNNNNNKLLYSHISKKHIDSTTVKHK